MGNSNSSGKSLFQRYQSAKSSKPISDEDLIKHLGKTREEIIAWGESEPGVGKNQLAGRAMAGPAGGLGGMAMADGYGGWGPSAEPNDGKRGMKFPPVKKE